VSFDINRLMQSAGALCDASTWAEARRIINENPLLLQVEPGSLLRPMIMMAGGMNDNAALASFRQASALLKRCQAVGVDAAFLELAHKEPKRVANIRQLLDRLEKADSIKLADFEE
jgi:hypothetical protein